jgi:hypothetical protein
MNHRAADPHGELPERHLVYDDGVEPGDHEPYAYVAAPATNTVRVCAQRSDTCIFRPGSPMHLQPGRIADMVTQATRPRDTWCVTRPWEASPRRSAEASPTGPTKAAASPCAWAAPWAR